MSTLTGADVKNFIVAARLQLVIVTLVLVCGWFLTTWLTPYKQKPDTQFIADSSVSVSYVRAEVITAKDTQGKARILEGRKKVKLFR